jgi:protocatechuate 3,4-dioxygenase beta subunit
MATYKNWNLLSKGSNMNRRNLIKTGAIGALGIASHAIASKKSWVSDQPTPPEIKGPFYPVVATKDKDFDLTKINGQAYESLGEAIFIIGGVFDTDGLPVEDVTVDLWQANAAGRYSHPHDTNPAPIDENFQGWAIVQSGKDGEFRFKTVLPGAYPVGDGWTRPPHIHFKVTKKGYIELITQMYFPDQPLNQVDRLLQRKNIEAQTLMIAEKSDRKDSSYYFRIVIEKA